MRQRKIMLKHLDSKPDVLGTKRHLFAGVRRVKPELHHRFRVDRKTNKNISFRQDIKSVGLFPTILLWETYSGEQKYAKVFRID